MVKKKAKKEGKKIFNIFIPQQVFDDVERAIYGNVKKAKKNGKPKKKNIKR